MQPDERLSQAIDAARRLEPDRASVDALESGLGPWLDGGNGGSNSSSASDVPQTLQFAGLAVVVATVATTIALGGALFGGDPSRSETRGSVVSRNNRAISPPAESEVEVIETQTSSVSPAMEDRTTVSETEGAISPRRGGPSDPPSRESSTPQPTELELISRARAALSREPHEALRALRQHAQLYPAGLLQQEREVIAIAALVNLGRVNRARLRATRFVADHPQTPHRRRIEALLGD